jgi:hypothetical protein
MWLSSLSRRRKRAASTARGQNTDTQGTESRLTGRGPADLKEVFGVEGGALASGLDGSLVFDLAEQIQSEVEHDSHVLGAVTGSDAGLILVKAHIEDPVKVVLNGPVASHGLGEGFGREGTRGDVGSPLGGDLFVALDLALDHGDGDDLWEAGRSGIGAFGYDPIDDM